MDKPREGIAKQRRTRRTILLIALAAVVALVTIGLAKLEPAAPTVTKNTLYLDTVKRGEMLREVRGTGTLVPVDIRFISAPVEGRIERLPLLPGARITPDTVIAEMTNPEVEQNALEAESQLRGAEAEMLNVRAELASAALAQQAAMTEAQSQSEQAKLQAQADQRLYNDQLIPELTLKLSKLRSDQLSHQAQLEKERYTKTLSAHQAQISAQQAKVNQMRAMYELRRRQLESLKVRAGIDGVLQELPAQVGQRLTPGTTIARVARPEKLKAELRIPETQVKDIVIGQKTAIDTRNGIVEGTVMRISPSVTEGTVTVDVALPDQLPKGARPALSVDGTIQIERLADTLYVARPTYGQANQKVEMFKVIEDGNAAERVVVQLGRSSVSTIEVVSGLNVGDTVILSDMQQYDGVKKVRLK
ncbi:MAG TPA: HlyD family efflux transporter periplasmic adaptor subunit [Thermoanaerobaculia bacterium]|jgi:HlyD family secretion protein|nr:HlyD family efflux transporter periplasmic adaptor subunit [Thermoanaerobaculia bacterium]